MMNKSNEILEVLLGTYYQHMVETNANMLTNLFELTRHITDLQKMVGELEQRINFLERIKN